jgi:hypothetical protein
MRLGQRFFNAPSVAEGRSTRISVFSAEGGA